MIPATPIKAAAIPAPITHFSVASGTCGSIGNGPGVLVLTLAYTVFTVVGDTGPGLYAGSGEIENT
jgi:hypothetical protein